MKCSYNKNNPLIKDMTLDVRKGHTIAIVGPTGSGKTTIVNLIMRFYEVDNGRIMLDGHDIRDYTRNALRGSVGMVLQDTWLFSGTIKDNIRYGRLDATDEEIIKAAKLSEIHEDILKMPQGYDTLVGERGIKLSGGQKQRVSIARALSKRPKLLLCDEPTGALDYMTGKSILKFLQDTSKEKNMTVIVITHNQAITPMADRVISMKSGRVVDITTNENPVSIEDIEW